MLASLALLFVVVVIDVWVYQDAAARTSGNDPVVFELGAFRIDTPLAWLLGCLLLFVVFLPLYLVSRGAQTTSRR